MTIARIAPVYSGQWAVGSGATIFTADRPVPTVRLIGTIATMQMRLVKQFKFEAAHFLPCFAEGHKCRRLHGHSFRFDVCVEGDVDPARGYLMDYGEIKKIVSPLVDRLDHYNLNDIPGLDNPTSEMLAVWIWDELKSQLPLLAEIVVYETCTSACHYRGK